MGLESVGDLALHVILTKLGPKETATAACVNKKLRSLASEDSLWFKFCSQDLHLNHPLDPLGNSTPSFKVSYQLWREAFSMYPWLLVMRVNRCWGRLKNWLDINFPEAKATLCKGVSEADIQESERILKVKLPLPTRILYRFCDGQESCLKQSLVSSHGSSLGLIGGYSFYQHFVNVYLLPLTEVILKTKAIVRRPAFSSRSKYIVVAASSTYVEKFFFLNCTTGQLYVGTANLPTHGEMIPCVPNALISSVHDFNGDQQQDAMLLWLEEHVRRLENGVIKLREEGGFKSINLFPEDSPLCSTAITNGVKVRASAVFVPESADLHNENEMYTFSYSIRMSLLPEGCVIHGICFSSCQLHRRHWIIRANESVVSDVNGEAVIGEFPLLLPGGKEFVYESCTPLPTSLGSIEGSYTFVPGRLKNPKGAPFEVEVARVPLQLPDYIF
ncbi:F-box protein SKIP16-like [Juglans microcarpa x Juglans regia]|uniref:F-box protein SKIP16-like n=1 Tax=Juglans microcarpa x Juglans regia TaxID=2249226 RepID=UPI001B7F6577|nr:F-box protein SKIP16-like [Juglans microcarpa x Juglans regia]